jgi:hypothetical protein
MLRTFLGCLGVLIAIATFAPLSEALAAPICGKVGRIKLTQIASGYTDSELYAEVEVNGQNYSVNPALANLAASARGTQSNLCVTRTKTTTTPADQGMGTTTETITFSLESEQ